MNNLESNSIFNRSGFASSSDLQTEGFQKIFSALEEQQSIFLDKADEFRSKEYKWPNDPLHCWSRIWEYPYAYYHLARYMDSFPPDSKPTVVDVGSGVTFFPFTVAQLGYEVICTDIDPICETDINRAKEIILHSPGQVKFRLIDNAKFPFADGKCDAVYCISVLEHIPKFESTVAEMARVLKPGGLCLITCDLDLEPAGNSQLNVTQYKRLKAVIEKEFCLLWPEQIIHPVDMLTSWGSPFASRQKNYARIGFQLIKQKILKPLLGRKPGIVAARPEHIAILGLVLRKY